MNRNADQFVAGIFEWFIGVIEDINDPEKINRVKVRCFGFHSQDKSLVTTKDLPWATVMMPATSASFKGIGSNHELVVGSWVVGFFRDGPSAQDPLVLGSIASKTEGDIDIPTEAQNDPPYNKVHKTEAGHLVEFDNTPGSERINIQHKSGTTINIADNGTVNIQAANNQINLLSDTFINGKLNVTGPSELNSTLSVAGAQTNQSTLVADGEVTAKGINLSSHIHRAQGPTSPTTPPL